MKRYRSRRGFGLISAEQAADIRRRYDRANAWLEANRRAKRGGWISYDPKDPDVPEFVRNKPSNEEVSELEVFNFTQQHPAQLFGYYDTDWQKLTTFTGQKLGDIVHRGSTYRARQATMRRVRVRAITGDEYEGPCAVSHGQYCRLKKVRKGGR